MKEYTVYKPSGEIVCSGVCQDIDFQYQNRDGCSIIEALGNIKTQYVEENTLKNMPEKPEGCYKFNYSSKSWIFDYDTADLEAKKQRNILLAEGPDRISPLWWSSMTQEQQQQWTNYRQALLDITEQINYPEHIVWPTKPE